MRRTRRDHSVSASRVNIGLRLKPTAGSASPSIARLIHAQILDAKQHSGSNALTPLDAVGSKEPTTNSIIQRCISARHQSAVEWRTLCHGRACTAGRKVRPTEAKMRGEIEQYFCFSTPRCCSCKATNQHASSIHCASRCAHVHTDPSLPRFRSGGTSRQTTCPEHRPAL